MTKDDNRQSLQSPLLVPTATPSQTRKRRYSKGSGEKTVLAIVQASIKEDRTPRFVLKMENIPKNDISLGGVL